MINDTPPPAQNEYRLLGVVLLNETNKFKKEHYLIRQYNIQNFDKIIYFTSTFNNYQCVYVDAKQWPETFNKYQCVYVDVNNDLRPLINISAYTLILNNDLRPLITISVYTLILNNDLRHLITISVYTLILNNDLRHLLTISAYLHENEELVLDELNAGLHGGGGVDEDVDLVLDDAAKQRPAALL